MERVVLPRAVVNHLLAEAQGASGGRTLGVVGALGGVPQRCHRLPEAADGADALRVLQGAGEELFALYEAHPHQPAHPEPTALARWGLPGLLYLPLCLDTRGVLEIRGFRLHAGGVREVALELAGPDDAHAGTRVR